nr:MAG TPA: hypothetical protein [Caudoviricetes sp.]
MNDFLSYYIIITKGTFYRSKIFVLYFALLYLSL